MINTHGLRIGFGKHKNELYTRLPRGYLQWLSNEFGIEPEIREIAKAELDRRGTVMPTLELSGHALDRASLRCTKKWESTRNENEGLYSWLMRVAAESRERGNQVDKGVYHYMSIKFVFAEGNEYPMLKSIMYRNK